jgi:hypothetical protein
MKALILQHRTACSIFLRRTIEKSIARNVSCAKTTRTISNERSYLWTRNEWNLEKRWPPESTLPKRKHPIKEYIQMLTDVGFGTIEIRGRRPYRILDTENYATDELIFRKYRSVRYQRPNAWGWSMCIYR